MLIKNDSACSEILNYYHGTIADCSVAIKSPGCLHVSDSRGFVANTSRRKTVPELLQAGREAEQHRRHCAEGGLEDLKRQLQQGRFRRRVDEGPAQGVSRDIDDHPQDHAHQRAAAFVILKKPVRSQGDLHSLQALRH